MKWNPLDRVERHLFPPKQELERWHKPLSDSERAHLQLHQEQLYASLPPHGSDAYTEEKTKLDLFTTKCPVEYRLFLQLIDPNLSGRIFYQGQAWHNDHINMGAWRRENDTGEVFEISHRIFPGRTLTVFFNTAGNAQFAGYDEVEAAKTHGPLPGSRR